MTLAPQLHYQLHGDPGGETVLLIHGFMSSNLQWQRNIDGLSKHVRLVLVELMGHGSSPSPVEIRPYQRAPVLAELDRIRSEVGVDSWFVGGHSLGGATAIRYALDYSERVKGVVFTNTRAAFGTIEAGAEAVAYVQAAGTDLRSLRYHPIGAKHFPADLKADMVAMADKMSPHVLINTVSNRAGWASVDDLHRLNMPVCLINGRYERSFQPLIEVAEQALPGIEVVHLEGGHSVNIEEPVGYNNALLEFVERHSVTRVHEAGNSRPVTGGTDEH